MKNWSELPHKAYSVNLNGHQRGLGMRDIWDQIPGAWNLLQLVWGQECEALLEHKGSPEDFPFDCGYVPLCVGMALQEAGAGKTWGDLAAESTPAMFLKILREHQNGGKTLLPFIFQQVFWEKAEAKAEAHRELAGNVIHVRFGVH